MKYSRVKSLIIGLLVAVVVNVPMVPNAWAQSENDKVKAVLATVFSTELAGSGNYKGLLSRELSTPGTKAFNAALNDLRARNGNQKDLEAHIRQGKEYYKTNFGLNALMASGVQESENDKVKSVLTMVFSNELASINPDPRILSRELLTPGTKVFNAALNDLRARNGNERELEAHIKQGKAYYEKNFGLDVLIAPQRVSEKWLAANGLTRNAAGDIMKGGTTVAKAGTYLIGNDNASIVGAGGGNIVGAGGGNIVGAGGGNIVGAGGGNIRQ